MIVEEYDEEYMAHVSFGGSGTITSLMRTTKVEAKTKTITRNCCNSSMISRKNKPVQPTWG